MNALKKELDAHAKRTMKYAQEETNRRARIAKGKGAKQTVVPVGSPLEQVSRVAYSAWELTYGLTGSHVASCEDNAFRFKEHDDKLAVHDQRIGNVEQLDKRLHQMITILLYKQYLVRDMWNLLAEQIEGLPDFRKKLLERYPDMDERERECNRLIQELQQND